MQLGEQTEVSTEPSFRMGSWRGLTQVQGRKAGFPCTTCKHGPALCWWDPLSRGMILIQAHPSDLCPSLRSLPAGILQIGPWGPAVCQVSPAQPLREPGSACVPL